MIVHSLLYVGIGALGGFAYQRIIGCRTGACPITANPYLSTLYGAFIGFMMSGARP